MQELTKALELIDSYLGSSNWFVYLLLGTGVFFTLYLGFPQFRYLGFAFKIVRGKFDKDSTNGDTSHFEALSTALSGTVGTGNIAGVAYAVFLGGPAALFWMLVTALIGMTTKFVEVMLSHKYRQKVSDGSISGGPMYYMRERLNITTKKGRVIKTGYLLAGVFAVGTIISSFGTGCLPQINSISNSLFQTFEIPHILTGIILSILLAFVIIGGIKRISKVTSKLVPIMAAIYFISALLVILYNVQNILPSLKSIFADVFTGTAAVGGFLGASIAFAFNRGVNRGLFSNEAGQGSAPIAHSASRAEEPVSEGLVALLEPFIDTIIICTLTGLTLLSSGVWNTKYDNTFQYADMLVVEGKYSDNTDEAKHDLYNIVTGEDTSALYTGSFEVKNGVISDNVSILHARSLAENVLVKQKKKDFTGTINVDHGRIQEDGKYTFVGKSLIHSAPLTAVAFSKSWLGKWGEYIVSIGLLLFAFSTSISWSYYGGRATTYLFGIKGVKYFRILYVIGFFIASFIDTSIIWVLSGIAIALMTIPNLIGMLILHKEVRFELRDFMKKNKKKLKEL